MQTKNKIFTQLFLSRLRGLHRKYSASLLFYLFYLLLNVDRLQTPFLLGPSSVYLCMHARKPKMAVCTYGRRGGCFSSQPSAPSRSALTFSLIALTESSPRSRLFRERDRLQAVYTKPSLRSKSLRESPQRTCHAGHLNAVISQV